MEKITIIIEASNAGRSKSMTREARRLMRRLNLTANNEAGYEILAINNRSGIVKKIVSRSLA